MPLGRLTRLSQQDLEKTYKDALLKVQNLMDILNDAERLTKVLRDEIIALRDKFGDERRTKIIAREPGDFYRRGHDPRRRSDHFDLPRQLHQARQHRCYRQQKRGGKGVNNTLKADDEPAHLFQVSTHHFILFFTDRGRVYRLRATKSRKAAAMPRACRSSTTSTSRRRAGDGNG